MSELPPTNPQDSLYDLHRMSDHPTNTAEKDQQQSGKDDRRKQNGQRTVVTFRWHYLLRDASGNYQHDDYDNPNKNVPNSFEQAFQVQSPGLRYGGF